jgi:hypothetical protein
MVAPGGRPQRCEKRKTYDAPPPEPAASDLPTRAVGLGGCGAGEQTLQAQRVDAFEPIDAALPTRACELQVEHRPEPG